MGCFCGKQLELSNIDPVQGPEGKIILANAGQVAGHEL
jgi:hypothetical protein